MYGSHMASDYRQNGANVHSGSRIGPISASPTRHTARARSGTSTAKIDPSFKSKRYRDKLREQIKALENLLPVDKATLHRKLDSQTVFRLAISFFRIQNFLRAAGLSSDRRTVDVNGPTSNEIPLLQQWNHRNRPMPSGDAPIIDNQKQIRLALEVIYVLLVSRILVVPFARTQAVCTFKAPAPLFWLTWLLLKVAAASRL